jgi:hypothetical protein
VALVGAKLQRQGSFEGLGLPCEFRACLGFDGLCCGPRVFLGIRALLMGSFCGQRWFSCVLRSVLRFLIYTILLVKKNKKIPYGSGLLRYPQWKTQVLHR